MVVPEQCTKQFALTVERRLKFLSNQHKEDQSTVGTVTRNIEGTKTADGKGSRQALSFLVIALPFFLSHFVRAFAEHRELYSCNDRLVLVGYDLNF